MKRISKYLLTCIVAIILLFTTAFTAFADDISVSDEQAMAESYAYQIVNSFSNFTEEDLDNYILTYQMYGYDDVANGFSQWKEVFQNAGALKEIKNGQLNESEDGIFTITANLIFENFNVTMKYQEDANGLVGLAFEKEATLGDKMAEAGGNLIVGMGTVFLVLIFLCGVIYLFKYIGKAESAMARRKAEKDIKPEETKTAPVITEVSPAPASNDELQAVIAAAIAAYESDNGCGIEKQPSLTNGINIKTYRRD